MLSKTSKPSTDTRQLVNWFLFYFNRLFATALSYGLRAYTWHKFRVWIDIQSLQISLLGGRIFFKGLRYHGANETVFIQLGYVTWRYWLHSTRQIDLTDRLDEEEIKTSDGDSTSNASGSSSQDGTRHPANPNPKNVKAEARIAVNVTGLEWYVYNRTPAYDAILQNVQRGKQTSSADEYVSGSPKTTASHVGDKAGLTTSSSGESYVKPEGSLSRPSTSIGIRRAGAHSPGTDLESTDQPPEETLASSFYTLILKLLPLAIECTKGAISLGNENTRALVVTTFAKARGHIDASSSRAKDIYRQEFDFEVEHPVVQMRPNPEYRQSQHTTAERVLQGLDSTFKAARWWRFNNRRQGRRLKHSGQLRKLFPGLTSSVESFRPYSDKEESHPAYTAYDRDAEQSTVWHGLDRYLDEMEHEGHEAWAQVDYARFSTILDCPAIHLNFYWDTPGPHTTEPPDGPLEPTAIGQKEIPPPGYGMDLIIRGGDVNYGPWADRLRLEIQSAFFPNSYHSASPAEPLGVGSERQYTIMDIRVHIEDDVTLRVPTREQSKDWQWRGRAHAVREAAIQRKHRERRHFRFRRNHKTAAGPEIRPFGWMSFTVGPNSKVHYTMGMIAGPDGYGNSLNLDLRDTRALSSVNHALLWRCPSHKIDCSLPYPLVWNDIHNWNFNVRSDDLEMFILRDHMFLLIDLINDFTAGQKSEFMTFVPYWYKIGLLFNNLKLYLNSNDFNIIDTPCNLEENAYLILGFGVLDGMVEIPLQYFAPRQSKVLFHADGQNATLDISAPTWNTLHTFLHDPEVPNLHTLATLKGLRLDGSYNYYTRIAPNLSDSLFMTITGYSPKFYLHGFLIRYFNNVKENYFGDHLHFRTLEEYQETVSDLENAPLHTQRPLKKENDLDVILTVRAEKSALVLPTNVYTRRTGIRADVLLVEADMRFTNYYMDLQVNSSPLEASIESVTSPDAPPDVSNCQLFIESAIVGGHRLFGAPPSEPTYSCHWDVDVGSIYGECSPEFLDALGRSIQSLIFTLDDYENALPDVLSTPIHDVNFFRVRTASTRLWIVSESTAFLAELAPATIDVSDWVGKNFSKHVNVDFPRVAVGAVELKHALRRQKLPGNSVDTLALFVTSCRLATLDKAAGLAHLRHLQQQHIRYHDQRTHRVDWLLLKSSHHDGGRLGHGSEWSRDPPSMPTPVMPEPLTSVTSADDNVEIPRSHRVRRQQSFLSSAAAIHQARGTDDRDSLAHTSPSDQPDRGSNSPQKVDSRGSLPTAGSIPFSSPWTVPHFTLQDVQLSFEDLPDDPLSQSMQDTQVSRQDLGKAVDAEDIRDFPHTGIICYLRHGLRGYCTPALIAPTAALIRALQPKSSLDRLDEVQQTVMQLVMRKLRPQQASKDVDLAIRLPSAHIRLVNASEGVDVDARPFRDQFDIRIEEGRADCRFMTRPMSDREARYQSQSFLVHTAIRNLSVSVSDDSPRSETPASASLNMANVGMWLSSIDRIKGTVQVNSIIGELGASEVRQMASLLHRSGAMVETAIPILSSLDDSTKTQHLIFHLTQAAKATSDPVFLTRPSYVLRSAGAHARTTESWKILARLRYTYAATAKESPTIVSAGCSCQDLELSDSSREEMMSIFDRWRVWDAVPDHKIPVMVAIFGQDVAADGSSTGPKPLELEFVVGALSLSLNPGQRQSSIVLNSLETAVTSDPNPHASKSRSRVKKLVVQAYMADFAVDLNWDLVELAGNILQIAQSTTAPSGETREHPTVLSEADADDGPLALEIVVGADLASISLRSPTLLVKLGSEDLRCSGANDAGQRGLPLAFTIASNSAMARVDGLQRSLLRWDLSRPKIYGSFKPASKVTKDRPALRMGADCERLRFGLLDDIPAVLRVAQAVVGTEVQEAYQCLAAIPSTVASKPSTARTGSELSIDLHIAMFLHDYKLDLVLLPSLRYAIVGKVARTYIVPHGDGQLVVNFDLKQHEHSFRGIWANSFEKPALLRMPPINGQVLNHYE